MASAHEGSTPPDAQPPLPVARTPTAEEQRLKQQILQECEADRALLLAAQPFTAKLLMQLQLIAVVDDRLPTAGTDGETLFVNARFMAGRTAQDRRFILAHEVWHCALGHHRRILGREPDTWNVACDYEVNALLREELGFCPADALRREAYQGLSAEQIYADLMGRSRRPQRGAVLDEHDLQGALMRSALVMDPDFNPKPVSAEAARAWQQRLIATAQQLERQRGDLPGHLAQLVKRLRHPRVPWQRELAGYIQTLHTGARRWLPPSRRHLHAGLYLPSHRGEELDLAVAIDTSGSCVSVLPEFLRELGGILGAADRVRLRVLEFDTRVTQERTLDEGQLHALDAWQCLGGGGSDSRPVFDRLRETPPQLLVVLTDGDIAVPEQAPGYAVIWCLTDRGRQPAGWGRKIALRRS